MSWQDRIEVDARILTGKPVVKGTRSSVELILDLVASGCAEVEILTAYPGLTHEDVLACVAYAAEIVRNERVFLISA